MSWQPPAAGTIDPMGDVRMVLPATQLFIETWDSGALDPQKWVATNGGTGTLPAPGVGALVMSGGTTLNSFAKLTSVPTFQPTQPGFLHLLSTLNFQFPLQTTANIFHGLGTSSATPTIAAPLIQGIGWMQQTSGLMTPMVYATGTAVPPGNWLASNQPKDANAHKYFFYFRGDLCYWCIDDHSNVVASFLTGAGGPDINGLPLLYQIISNSGAAATLQINGITLSDTAHSTTRINDGTYPWRYKKVGANGEIYVQNPQAPYPSAPTNIVSAAADTAIVAANANRRQLIVSNDSTSKLYLLVDQGGAGVASATNYTYCIAPGATFVMPIPVSTARIRGFWSAANGTAGVTDISGGTVAGSA